MTWSVTIEKGRGSERTGVRSVRTLVVVSPESLETAGGAQKTQALPFRISIHPEAYTCIPVILTDDHPAINCRVPHTPPLRVGVLNLSWGERNLSLTIARNGVRRR